MIDGMKFRQKAMAWEVPTGLLERSIEPKAGDPERLDSMLPIDDKRRRSTAGGTIGTSNAMNEWGEKRVAGDTERTQKTDRISHSELRLRNAAYVRRAGSRWPLGDEGSEIDHKRRGKKGESGRKKMRISLIEDACWIERFQKQSLSPSFEKNGSPFGVARILERSE
ncbi:hypothetical protein KM043_012694 [Ampulex compressa]|nr:hypothetical protein KM043_012694 [Ampulex compressa]